MLYLTLAVPALRSIDDGSMPPSKFPSSRWILVFVELLQRLVVGVADFVGVDRAGLERERRQESAAAAAADRRR